MKPTTTSLTGHGSLQTTSSHETRKLSNPFTWAKVHAQVLRLKERLPEEWQDLAVKTIQDTKMIVSLMMVFFVLLLPFIVVLPILVKLAATSYSWNLPPKKGGRK